MNICGARSWGPCMLAAVLAAAAGCADVESTSSAGDAIVEAENTPAADTEVAPSADDLTGPAVDESDPASVQARALFELVGPDVFTAPATPAAVSTRPAGAGPGWSEEMPAR